MTRRARRRAVIALLASSVAARRGPWLRLLAWSTVEALPAFFSGRLIARAIDHGFLARDEFTGLGWLGLLAASFAAGAWGTRQTYRSLAAVVEPFRDELTTLAVTGALRRSTTEGQAPDGATSARLTQQVEIVRETYASVLFVTQSFLVTTVSALVGLVTLLPNALVLVLPPLAVALCLFVATVPRLARLQRESILADERIAESAGSLAAGFRDIAACGGEQRIAATAGAEIDAQADVTNRLARLAAARTLAIAIGGLLPLVLVLTEASWLRRHGATAGAIVGVLTYILQGIHPPLQTLVRGIAGTGTWLAVTLGRIVEATTDTPVTPTPGTPRPHPSPVGNDVRFAGMTFRYGEAWAPIVRGLRFAVPDGAHLAIVGPSGVGKSTLANLIAGLLEPEAGEIRLGGAPIRELEPRRRASSRVLIPQEAYVFAGGLRENLAYLRDDVADSELDEACALLGASELIDRLGGYDAQLDPGRLSAGERQLITLVRAYVAPAGVVVLDEATCHLDPRAEALVETVFARRPGTLIVIAHRISSAVRADRVLLLDGRQALLGTHDGLLAGSQLYRDLVGHWESGSPSGRPPLPSNGSAASNGSAPPVLNGAAG